MKGRHPFSLIFVLCSPKRHDMPSMHWFGWPNFLLVRRLGLMHYRNRRIFPKNSWRASSLSLLKRAWYAVKGARAAAMEFASRHQTFRWWMSFVFSMGPLELYPVLHTSISAPVTNVWIPTPAASAAFLKNSAT